MVLPKHGVYPSQSLQHVSFYNYYFQNKKGDYRLVSHYIYIYAAGDKSSKSFVAVVVVVVWLLSSSFSCSNNHTLFFVLSPFLFFESNLPPPSQPYFITTTKKNIAVRSLLLPLSVQQSKSAEYMKALKPYIKEIQEKFQDNDDQKNRAIGKLYEDAEQNPLSGCLVSLAQLPIFLGLYRGIRLLAQDGKLDEPFLWIPSLQGPVTAPNYRGLEWLTEGWSQVNGLWTPQLGWETTLAFLVMPVVLVLGQKLTMTLLTPEQDDDSMSDEDKEQAENAQRIIKFLPLLIGFFSLQVPAGLTVYWFTSNNFTLLQSLGVRAYYNANPPKIELPDYWDAIDDLDTMTPEEKRKAAEAGLSVGPKFSDMVEGTFSQTNKIFKNGLIVIYRPFLTQSCPL